MPGRPLRPSSFAALFALAFLVFTGCASSGPGAGSEALFSQAMPFPGYAKAEPVEGLERSTLCHQGRTITIVNLAVEQHMRHGDYFGECSEENRTRHARYYSGQGEPAEAEASPETPTTTASLQGRNR